MKFKIIIVILLSIFAIKLECKISTPKSDESTLSNFSEIIPEHTTLELEVDFNKKK